MPPDVPLDHKALRSTSGVAYGHLLRGALPAEFGAYLLRSAGPVSQGVPRVDVGFQTLADLPEMNAIWASDDKSVDGRFVVFREDGGLGLMVSSESFGIFRFGPAAISIEWHGDYRYAAHHFFIHALPLWLEWRGIQVLHASAVAIGGRAVAFIGSSGHGKSTLCSALVAKGCDFVADDALSVRKTPHGEWFCEPGPPFLRLWPRAFDHLPEGQAAEAEGEVWLGKRRLSLGHAAGIDPMTGLKLAMVLVLDRQPPQAAAVSISECSARESLVHLLQHGVAAAPAAALGLSALRLDQLWRLSEQTKVRILRYPGDTDCWGRIRALIGREM